MYEIFQDDTFFRRSVVKNYLVFYTVDEAEGIIRIYRILHSSRDLDLKQYLNKA
ncbi:type II toxin-antitoxin system RelE/ParE family toxin [Ruminiclostridium herbifermentans]